MDSKYPPKNYSRTCGPCPDCKLKGYVGNNPLDICKLCNGGGWCGYHREAPPPSFGKKVK